MIIISHKQISAVFNRSVGSRPRGEPRGMVSRELHPLGLPASTASPPPASAVSAEANVTRFNLLAWNRKHSNAVCAIGRHLREPDDARRRSTTPDDIRRRPTIPDRCLRIRASDLVGVRSDIFGKAECFRRLFVLTYKRTQRVPCGHFGVSTRDDQK
ncbi:hypothetical protein EVAR_20379_1 [Eumeta japonica]|uniref:Uncharacterized protein n=1 Tax=Eumeta variegata TaxID=151549 RepID=A0A4C1ZRD4_EUMVA|nr:hypothetical protein EVAR_20379_1 [Eumeta japonica]